MIIQLRVFLQRKSKDLKGMYKCNILLQTPYAVLFTIIKKNIYKAPAPFPRLYIYTNQWQILHRSLIYSCIEREEEEKEHTSDSIKPTSLSLGIQCFTISSRTHSQSKRHVPGSHAVFWWSGTCNRWFVEKGFTAHQEALVNVQMNTSHCLWEITMPVPH